MNTSNAQKLKIGLFTIAGILVLLVGIFLIGSKKNMFGGTYTIYGKFKNAGGLMTGNNIRFGGVNIGTVEEIRVLTDTVVRIEMRIQTKMREFIKTDAVATIGSDGLMGDKVLVIAPGSPDAPQIAAGGELKTAEPMDIGTVMAQFARVADNAETITGALADMSLQIKNGNGSISRLLYQDDLAKGLEGTLNNTRDVTGALNDVARQIRSGQGSVGSLLYTNRLSNSLEQTANQADEAMATIQTAAYNFSENMRALQGNYFFRGYFKRKARSGADSVQAVRENGADNNDEEDMDDMTVEELEEMKADAERALEAKKTKGAKKGAVPIKQP